MNGRWLIRLYPPTWRRRYAGEFAELLASQPMTLAMIIDIVAGAMDARVRPQAVPGSDTHKGDRMMTNLFTRCATGGPQLDARDRRMGMAITFATTLVLAALYVAAAARYRGNELVDAFGVMLFPMAMTLALPFTYLKDQTLLAKTVVLSIALGVLALASYVAVLI